MIEVSIALASLSERQKQILRYVGEQYTSKEIGRILLLSDKTIDSHVNKIMARLEVTSRREAAALLRDWEASQQKDELSTSQPQGMMHNNYGHQSDVIPHVHSGAHLTREQFEAAAAGRPLGRPASLLGRVSEGLYRLLTKGMFSVVIRYALDAIYIGFFFVVMAGLAFLAHLAVELCTTHKLDPLVIKILHVVEIGLVGIDAIGILLAAGFMAFRFVRALVRVKD